MQLIDNGPLDACNAIIENQNSSNKNYLLIMLLLGALIGICTNKLYLENTFGRKCYKRYCE
jgi:hypothetical protein